MSKWEKIGWVLVGILAPLAVWAVVDEIRNPTKPQPVSQERPWDNDRVIEETKKCEAAGLKAEAIYNGWTYKIHRVQCMPKH